LRTGSGIRLEEENKLAVRSIIEAANESNIIGTDSKIFRIGSEHGSKLLSRIDSDWVWNLLSGSCSSDVRSS
jgi:hypothetical protein